MTAEQRPEAPPDDDPVLHGTVADGAGLAAEIAAELTEGEPEPRAARR